MMSVHYYVADLRAEDAHRPSSVAVTTSAHCLEWLYEIGFIQAIDQANDLFALSLRLVTKYLSI